LGEQSAAELATYIVEKGKPLLVLVDGSSELGRNGWRRTTSARLQTHDRRALDTTAD
jgi:hypothetical protein